MRRPCDLGGSVSPAGHLVVQLVRDLGRLQPPTWRYHLRNFLRYRRREILPAGLGRLYTGLVEGAAICRSELQAVVYRRPEGLTPWQIRQIQDWLASGFPALQIPRYAGGQAVAYGTLSCRVVTNAGVAYLVDAFQNLTELENLRFHGYGTGTNAEAVGDTALQTELTTQYATDNTRPTGTQTENAANIFETVATLSPDSGGTLAITEHGIFSQAAIGGGTLLDRSVFSAINLVAGTDSLQTTYRFTVTAGG